jgi:cellulose synthase operon protein C
MSARSSANHPSHTAWSDRPAASGAPRPSPRSQRDLDILRSLGRRINAQDASAHNNLGVVYYHKGLYDDAVRHFEHALELDPRMQVAERNLQICYFGTGYLERVSAGLRQRLEEDPEDGEARDRLARTLYNSGDTAGAIRELRRLVETRPHDAALHQRLARAELKHGDMNAALASLRLAESRDPDNASVQFMIGEVLYQRGLNLDAREPLERAIELDERMAAAYHLLAFVYGDLGDMERARRTSARAAELNPTYVSAEAGLSLDSYSTARYRELIGSRGAVEPAVAEGAELAHYNVGLALRQKALYDEAMREFQLAAERGENSFLVQQAQAELLLLRGSGAAALELYGRLVREEPASPKLWNELGVAHHQIGELEAAEQSYRQALGLDPEYALALNNLGVVRHHREGTDGESWLRQAVDQGRALPDIWRNLALLLHRSGRSSDSAAAYRQALAADPSSPQAATGYGILLMDMERPEEARTHLLHAIQIEPKLAEARYHLAFALSALGDFEGALRETRLALELNPYIPTPRFRLLIDLQFEEAAIPAPELDAAALVQGADVIQSFEFHPGALDNLFDGDGAGPLQGGAEPGTPRTELIDAAQKALEQGRLELATSHAQHAAMRGARGAEVLLLQGEIFLRRGAAGEAVERFSNALGEIARDMPGEDEPLRRALHGAARSLLELGRMPEAVEAAERLVELVPGDVEALRTLGEALARVHDFVRAALVLEQARLSAPDDANLLTQLGLAYAGAGDPEGAESALRRATILDAGAVAARSALGHVLAAENRLAEAEAEFEAALRTLPSYGDAAFGLAGLHERRGRLRQAIHVMADLLSVDPYRLDALNRLAELLARAGMVQEARYAYERVLRFDPHDGDAHAGLARLGGSEG